MLFRLTCIYYLSFYQLSRLPCISKSGNWQCSGLTILCHLGCTVSTNYLFYLSIYLSTILAALYLLSIQAALYLLSIQSALYLLSIQAALYLLSIQAALYLLSRVPCIYYLSRLPCICKSGNALVAECGWSRSTANHSDFATIQVYCIQTNKHQNNRIKNTCIFFFIQQGVKKIVYPSKLWTTKKKIDFFCLDFNAQVPIDSEWSKMEDSVTKLLKREKNQIFLE